MIASYIERHAQEKPGTSFLIDDAGSLSFRESCARAQRIAAALRKRGAVAGGAIYLYAENSIQLILALLAADYCGARVTVVNRSFGGTDLLRIQRYLPPGPLITDAPTVPEWNREVMSLSEIACSTESGTNERATSEGIVILTTGTTGPPKAVLYQWDRLLAQVRAAESAITSRWALLYPLNHFAGLSILLHSAKNGLSLALPRSRQFPDVADCFARHEVDSASGTPTFWRVFMGQLDAETASRIHLKQITLGGEPVTGDILSRLRGSFPGARITQVFATTELGSCFSVSDALPGFPAEFLNGPVGNVQLRVYDGQLYVRTALGMAGYVDGSAPPETDGDWVATGDLVAIRDDRVHFLGRKGEVINVGGVKVFPPSVEEHIRCVPGVQDVRVYGKPNPVTGQIVAADLEVTPGAAAQAVLALVKAACREKLSRYEQPRELRIVVGLRRSNEKLTRI